MSLTRRRSLNAATLNIHFFATQIDFYVTDNLFLLRTGEQFRPRKKVLTMKMRREKKGDNGRKRILHSSDSGK